MTFCVLIRLLRIAATRDIARIYRDQVPVSMLESVLHDLMIGNLKGSIYFSNRTKEVAQWAQKVNSI